MKRTDMETGVVYAYQAGKHDVIQAIIVLDTTGLYAQTNRGYGRMTPEDAARPLHTKVEKRLGMRTTVGRYSDYRAGFLAATTTNPTSGGYKRDHDKADPATLRDVTLDQALTHTYGDRAHHKPLVGTQIWVDVIDPRFILGVYEDVMQADAEAKELEANIKAQEIADAEARMIAQEKRIDALRALGVTGKMPNPRSRYSKSEGHTQSVVLSPAQFEQVMSLIPDGAHVEEEWEYPAPEGGATD